VLEASRRSVGFWFFVTTLLFVAYLVLSPWLPGFLRSPRAYSYPRLVEMFAFYADEGVVGSLTGISSTILMVFILFASFMLHSGVGQFFMDISVALAGRFRGGPAKVAVLSSGLYGTISGSSVADCYATGSFTIPLMKRIGYKPEIAGAIEACASCGGPLMPPIMGAGAFIMAELTGAPYSRIVVAAALPPALRGVRLVVRGRPADHARAHRLPHRLEDPHGLRARLLEHDHQPVGRPPDPGAPADLPRRLGARHGHPDDPGLYPGRHRR